MNPARKTEPTAAGTPDPWTSVPKAAKALGIAAATVYALALKGELETQQADGRVFVSRASIEAYLARTAGTE
ncbi:MAG: helix-turn-helix domain-containing protein [Kofleriaceae bacterium]